MDKLLVKGNKKIDKSVLCFSIPPVSTCLNCGSCKHTCYALKSFRLYPNVRNAWTRNYEISQNTDAFIEVISEQLKHSKCTQVRVHVSGDFYSIDYINAWHKIASAFPSISFWTYTKCYGLNAEMDNALNALNALNNFNIVDSMPLSRVNFGDDDYITQLAQDIETATGKKPFVCPCGHDDSIVCGKACKACQTHKYVLFKKH